MHHRPRTEEEERLEETVGEQVEYPRGEAERAHREDHEAELADGGVGEGAFEVVLGEGEDSAEEGGEQPDGGDGVEDARGVDEHGREAGEEVDAGDHEGRGVDERAHRRGALHRVGEPDVEGELGRLAGHADEDERGGEVEAR